MFEAQHNHSLAGCPREVTPLLSTSVPSSGTWGVINKKACSELLGDNLSSTDPPAGTLSDSMIAITIWTLTV